MGVVTLKPNADAYLVTTMRRKTQAEFLAQSKAAHGDKYDYSKAVYETAHVKVEIICPKHGSFFQSPNNHLRYGCNKCGFDASGEACRTHGTSGKNDPIYNTWAHIRMRCNNPQDSSYENYGGRGIKVCDRWMGEDGFVNFRADMGPRPSPKHSIDRIDNDGDYTPTNCRWATKTEQVRNRRVTRTLTHNGETLSLVEWSERTGIAYDTLKRRKAMGWSDEKTVTEPIQKGRWSK